MVVKYRRDLGIEPQASVGYENDNQSIYPATEGIEPHALVGYENQDFHSVIQAQGHRTPRFGGA